MIDLEAVADEIARALRHRALPTPETQRALRRAAGISRAKEAEWLGVTEPTISRWESGKRQPSSLVLDAYLALLDQYRRSVA